MSSTMKNLLNQGRHIKGLATDLPPLHEIEDIFKDLVERALSLELADAFEHLADQPLRVATCCSGTESPLLALSMISDAAKDASTTSLNIEHLFSSEIVPFKQAYIERNFNPPVIFRDIREMTNAVDENIPMATTVYGSRVHIPGDVHLLIAGTSCVDFSRLNNHQQDLEEAGSGESSTTFFAVLNYVKRFRPRMVLLENVRGAAWAKMLANYSSIGYASGGVLVDTKDYYIPHTRQRGYMICIDKAHPDAQKAVSHWQDLMSAFQRRASSPLTAFLLPPDATQRRSEAFTEPPRDIEWLKCRVRQVLYREQNRLGHARPFTKWKESGTVSVPENGSAAWYRKQSERVKDSIDCAILRKAIEANGGYDGRFKTRTWDLSQNIDRAVDSGPFGISTCITPNGIVYVSDAGRVLTAEETLKLQGIPLERISFTTETSAELQDLAGNAMTSTVVGAAILSALICGHKALPRGTCPSNDASEVQQLSNTLRAQSIPQSGQQDDISARSRATDMVNVDGQLATTSDSISALVQMAYSCRRLCICEIGLHRTTAAIRQCLACDHTACIRCAGNPTHEYGRSTIQVSNLQSPADVARKLRASLPLHLSFDCQDIPASAEKHREYHDIVSSALSKTFSIGPTRRTSTWTTTFNADQARLELKFNKNGAIWNLFVNSPHDLPSDSTIRKSLERPIARCVNPSGIDSKTLWDIRQPEQSSIPIRINGFGSRVPSWWARCQLPDYKDHAVWEFLDIDIEKEDIVHALRPICGRYHFSPACGTANDSLYVKRSGDGRHIFLFKDPSRTGNPALDCFVFAYDKEPVEYDEVRPIIARIEPSWAPWHRDNDTNTTPADWSRPHVYIDVWTPTDVHLVSSLVNVEVQVSDLSAFDVACNTSAVLARCLCPQEHTSSHAQNPSSLRWVTELLKRHLPDSSWRLIDMGAISHYCNTCAPIPPMVTWRSTNDGTAEPYEEPTAAADYECRIKNRPTALFLEHTNDVTSLHINVQTLAHRAYSALPAEAQITRVQWRLRDYNDEVPFTFRPFRLQTSSGGHLVDSCSRLRCTLYPTQRAMLAWMLQQETGVDLPLETSEEASLPKHDWKLEVRAQARLTARCGICADHPGFGKTIISLALIAESQSEATRAASRLRHGTQAPNLFLTDATLIVCPQSLTRQWADEIDSKLGYSEGQDYVVISSVSDLRDHTAWDLQHVKVILVSRAILVSEDYVQLLAASAGTPVPASYTGHTFVKWLDHVQAQLDKRTRPALPRYNIRTRSQASGFDAAETVSQKITTPVLHEFCFSRIIVDEFHDLSPAQHAALVHVRADKRWGLSATPKMNDLYDIAQMAALVGVPLLYGSLSTRTMRLQNIRALQKTMSDFERFDSMRETPSDSAHALMYDMDKLFLQSFVRQNLMDFAELPVEQHLFPVTLSLDHYATYHEMFTRLYCQGMVLRKARNTELNIDKRLAASTKGVDFPEEALSRLAARQSPEESLPMLIEHAMCDFKVMQKKLISAMRNAQKLLNDVFDTQDVVDLLEEHDDSEVKVYISRLLDSLSKVRIIPQKRSRVMVDEENDDDGRSRPAAQQTAMDLLDYYARLLAASRSLRYLQSANSILNLSCYRSGGTIGSRLQHSEDTAISALCGHVICEICHRDHQKDHKEQCSAPGCDSEVSDELLLWHHTLYPSAQTTCSNKIAAAVNLLTTIATDKEQAVVFVQYVNQLKDLEDALKQADIRHSVVKQASKANRQVVAFQKDCNMTAIVLTASDETAAGLNLQVANHVIFMSPLLRTTQYSYEATMAQAIGRVKRHGQKKTIHVYRIYALHTIDVDILEHREPGLGVRSGKAGGFARYSKTFTDDDE